MQILTSLLSACLALTIAGSSSAAPLVQALAKSYGPAQVQSIGTTAGIEAVKNGTADLACSSRDLTEQELQAGLQAQVLALDTLAVIVSPDVEIEDLSLQQLRDIYSGKTKTWPDGTLISVVSREAGSGTRASFEALVGPVQPDALICDGSGFVRLVVENHCGAIGYVSASVLEPGARCVRIDGLSYSDEAYPLQRRIYLVSAGRGESFLSFTQTPQARSIIRSQGYLTP